MFRASAYNNDQKYALLHDLAELNPPFTVKAVPVRTTKLDKLYCRFHAMLDEVAEHKGWSRQERDEFKKDTKVHWGKVEYRHDHITGKKAYRIPSINDYSEAELRTLVGELDRWMAENGIFEGAA